jgi:ATP-dependent RNA helicase DeaD
MPTEQPDDPVAPTDVATPDPVDATDGDATGDGADVSPDADDPADTAVRADAADADTGDEAPSGFETLGLRDDLLQQLDHLGYEEPTPIQLQAIPSVLAGRDLLGQAATGTGKTAAFALPILHHLGDPSGGQANDGDVSARSDRRSGPDAPRALVLVPTRELAMQVSQAMHTYGQGQAVRVLPVYGGQPIWRQLKELARGVDVVVATPGRAVDHLGRGTLDLDHVEVVVLDEADEMLDLGFAEDLETILAATPEHHQTLLFSATMPPRIGGLARRHLVDPIHVEIGRDPATSGTAPKVRQSAYVVSRAHKPAALGRVLDVEAPGAAIVFCGTRTEVDELTEVMNGRGYRAEALHGGMSQEQRDRVMDRLRGETADLLVATDVAARGLDIDHLTHVVNYDVPSAPESYVHRIGRVGRAGREGVAITLVEPRQQRQLKAIERHTGQALEIEPVPSVADLRARRLELTREGLKQRLLDEGSDLDRFRGVVESLSDEADLMELTLAAIAVAHEALAGDDTDEEELPEVRLHRADPGGKGGKGKGGKGGPGGKGRKGRADAPPADIARIYIGAGRNQGIRPKDLVGAIANESGLSGRDVGNIDITPNFSLVDVPRHASDEVIRALRGSTIKGRRATVRPDRETS